MLCLNYKILIFLLFPIVIFAQAGVLDNTAVFMDATSSNLTSTDYGALYYCDDNFSSYVYGDYARYSSVSSAYVIEEFDYYRILNVYDLIGRHMQIDLEEDNKNRI